MRRLFQLLAIAIVPCTLAQDPAPAPAPPASDPSLALRHARSTAHEVGAAGAYNQRAAIWEREVKPGEVALLPVQLYAGNEYQIIVGFDAPSAKLGLAVFDARGRLVPAGVHRGQGRMVLAIKPERSEVYQVRLRLTEADAVAAAAALTYVYK